MCVYSCARAHTQTHLYLNFTVDILLKATANAPIMKQKKWSVCQDNPIGRISEFIKKYLKLDPNERLVSQKILLLTYNCVCFH